LDFSFITKFHDHIKSLLVIGTGSQNVACFIDLLCNIEVLFVNLIDSQGLFINILAIFIFEVYDFWAWIFLVAAHSISASSTYHHRILDLLLYSNWNHSLIELLLARRILRLRNSSSSSEHHLLHVLHVHILHVHVLHIHVRVHIERNLVLDHHILKLVHPGHVDTSHLLLNTLHFRCWHRAFIVALFTLMMHAATTSTSCSEILIAMSIWTFVSVFALTI